MEDSIVSHSPDATPQPNRFIRHVWLSPAAVRDGGGFYLDPQEYILSAVLRTNGGGIDMLIVAAP